MLSNVDAMLQKVLLNRQKRIILSLRLFITIALMILFTVAHGQPRIRRVLYINSYSLAFPSALEQYQGIMSVLDSPHVVIDTEYMDCKRFPTPSNVQSFKQRLEFSLSRLPRYDAVITGDDYALHFAVDNHQTLFKGAPIFFMGVNDVNYGLQQNSNPSVTGLLERAPFQGTLSLMSSLYPRHKKIYVIADHGVSSYSDYRNVQLSLRQFAGLRCETIWFDRLTTDELSKKLASLEEDVPLLFLSGYIDKTGKTYSLKDALRIINAFYHGPIFYAWSMGLKYGAFGGLVISHYDQGRIAALMLKRYFDGVPVDKMRVVTKTPYRYMFNYQVMQRYHISVRDLPANSIFYQKPATFYEQNKVIVISTAIFIAILIILIIFLVRSSLRRRQAAIELLVAKNKAEEGDRLKSEFIRNLSHEIRTPLHSIIGFSDLLSSDPGAQKDNATYIAVIRDSVKQLMSIIRKVLEISSLESKVEKANFEDISIRDLLSDQFEIFRAQAEQKGLSYFNDNKDQAQDYVISTDPHQLIRILGYLLENAIKFTDAGGEVHLGYREANDYLIIHVKDTGVGISKEQQQIIFGRFVQGDYQLSRKYDGIGLGLAISRETARLLGGDITLESEQGKGTTFFIHLPKG